MNEELKSRYPKRLLLVKYRGMGDAIIGQSSISYLKSVFPESHIVYAVPGWVAIMFKHLDCQASEVWPLSLASTIDWLRLAFKILRSDFDVIVELHQSGRTKILLSIVAWLKRIPYFAHNHNTSGSTFILGHGVTKPSIQRDLDGVWPVVNTYQKDLTPPSYLNFPPRLGLLSPVPPKNELAFGLAVDMPREGFELQSKATLSSVF